LKESELKKIASDESGWNMLYFHERTSAYWEKTYPNSEFHSGGQPKFKRIELSEEVKNKYRLS
jgi:hypothetical protein